MTIELSSELEQLVEEQVKTGLYASPSAVVNAAIAHMFAEQSPEEIAELRALVAEGVADLDAGRVVTDWNLKDFLGERRRGSRAGTERPELGSRL